MAPHAAVSVVPLGLGWAVVTAGTGSAMSVSAERRGRRWDAGWPRSTSARWRRAEAAW